ncbi:MAG: hypothetical protein MUE51_14525 [Thermoleophilia bacterium]|nr:hypothetical protein [Thermoleophilia bacterium]
MDADEGARRSPVTHAEVIASHAWATEVVAAVGRLAEQAAELAGALPPSRGGLDELDPLVVLRRQAEALPGAARRAAAALAACPMDNPVYVGNLAAFGRRFTA